MASHGTSLENIAKIMGCSRATFYNRPDLMKVLNEGRAVGLHKIENVLFKLAINGNLNAVVFYLKTRGGDNWSEDKRINVDEDTIGYSSINLIEDSKDTIQNK